MVSLEVIILFSHTCTFTQFMHGKVKFLLGTCLVLILSSHRADDVASDFTLRGVNVQSIHGDR